MILGAVSRYINSDTFETLNLFETLKLFQLIVKTQYTKQPVFLQTLWGQLKDILKHGKKNPKNHNMDYILTLKWID
jgi:hypothetical protein